MIKLEEDDILI